MRTIRIRTVHRLIVATLAVLAGVAAPLVASAGGRGKEPNTPSLTRAEAKLVREATKRYRNVDAALAAGYLPTEECAALPGVGGMGFHYVNPGYLMDGALDPTKPEVLLFHVDDDGELKLGGVEYFAADADQDVTTDADRPWLFGHPFDGPMPGHDPQMPVHYDLHVWLYTKNPTGQLAPWNPKITCQTTPAPHEHD